MAITTSREQDAWRMSVLAEVELGAPLAAEVRARARLITANIARVATASTISREEDAWRMSVLALGGPVAAEVRARARLITANIARVVRGSIACILMESASFTVATRKGSGIIIPRVLFTPWNGTSPPRIPAGQLTGGLRAAAHWRKEGLNSIGTRSIATGFSRTRTSERAVRMFPVRSESDVADDSPPTITTMTPSSFYLSRTYPLVKNSKSDLDVQIGLCD